MAYNIDGSSALKDSDYEKNIDLNRTKVSSIKEAIKILEELEATDGEIIKGSVLEKSILNYLGSIETDDVAELIKDLQTIEKLSADKIENSAVSEAKIRELVEDYEKYVEKGLNDKEALDKIYKDNKGKIPPGEIENFVQKQREIHQEKIKNLIKENSKELIDKNKVQQEIKKNDEKVVDLKKYKKEKDKAEIQNKVEELSERITVDLKGDENLKKEIQNEFEEVVKQDKVKSQKDEISDLVNKIVRVKGVEKNTEIEIKAKEASIELDKWQEENIEEVREFRKDNFKEKFEKETREKNPNITEEQVVWVNKEADMIADIYYSEGGIENQKNSAFEFNQNLSPGQLENGWSEIQGVVGILRKSPKEFDQLQKNYIEVKENLGDVGLPYEMPNVRSFEGIMDSLQDSPLGLAFGELKSRFGGWLNKNIVEIGGNFAIKIGGQAAGDFVKNTLGNFFEKGISGGLKSVFQGILSGGVKAGVQTAVTTGVAVGTEIATEVAVSATGWGAIVVAVRAVVKVLKKIGSKIAEKLGISTKEFLNETFGKVGGKIVGWIIGGAMAILAIPVMIITSIVSVLTITVLPIIITVIGISAILHFFQTNSVSSLAPIESVDQTGVANYGNYPETVGSYPDTKTGLMMYVFEKGSVGRTMTQRYDLAFEDNGAWLEPVKGKNKERNYVVGKFNQLDKRIIGAYTAMVDAGALSGQLSQDNDLKLIAGYRPKEEQKRLWDKAVKEYGAEDASTYATPPDKLSPHATGRAVDIVIDGGCKSNEDTKADCIPRERASRTHSWLVDNAANYGFYPYDAEPWHWEYNPIDQSSNAL